MTEPSDPMPKKSPVERALKDAARDRTLADDYRDAVDLQELHALCRRMIDEREALAKAFDAVLTGWTLVGDKAAPHSDATAAIERIATEAIQFAREVLHALKPLAMEP